MRFRLSSRRAESRARWRSRIGKELGGFEFLSVGEADAGGVGEVGIRAIEIGLHAGDGEFEGGGLGGLGAVDGPAEVGDVVAAGGLVAVGGLEEGDRFGKQALKGVAAFEREGGGGIEDLGEEIGGEGGRGRDLCAAARGANFE